MPTLLPSSEVQQNFGRVMEQALTDEDVIVERYGQPRVAILSYQRYQTLMQQAEQGRAVHPHRSPEAEAAGRALADDVRSALQAQLDGSLDEVMASLRGRSWSS